MVKRRRTGCKIGKAQGGLEENEQMRKFKESSDAYLLVSVEGDTVPLFAIIRRDLKTCEGGGGKTLQEGGGARKRA